MAESENTNQGKSQKIKTTLALVKIQETETELEGTELLQPSEDDIDELLRYVEKGKIAFDAGCLEEAKQYFLKAQILYPSSKVAKFLEDIKSLASKKLSEEAENKESPFACPEVIESRMQANETEKCMEFTKSALSIKNFDKCKQFLLKAQQNLEAIKDAIYDTDVCLENPQMTFEVRDLSTAVQFLAEAEKMYSDMKNKFMPGNESQSISESEEGPKSNENSESTFIKKSLHQPILQYEIVTKKDKVEVNKCIKVAETALSVGNYEKAEKFLNKAQRMCQTSTSEELLLLKVRLATAMKNDDRATKKDIASPDPKDKEIPSENAQEQNLQSETYPEEYIDVATKSMEIAQKAFTEGNFEKAERFCFKADRMCPNGYSRELLKQIQLAKQAGIISESTSTIKRELEYEQNSKPSTSERKEDYHTVRAKKCMENALIAIRNQNFDEALLLVSISDILDPKDDTKVLLNQIKAIKATGDTPQNVSQIEADNNGEKLNQRRFPGTTDDEKKMEAERYKELAGTAYATGNIDNATNFLLIAWNLFPSQNIKDLVEEVKKTVHMNEGASKQTIAQKGNVSNERNLKKMQRESKEARRNGSYYYLDHAEKAYERHSFDEAEKFALKAESVRSTARGQRLLKKIRLERVEYNCIIT